MMKAICSCSDVQNYDFFAEGKQDFYSQVTEKSILVQGKHRNPAPLITILLTTYKRPDLLKQSLESALNQVDFDDYQIIIADNEGENINIETETSKLVAGYQNEKIVYYRHEQSVGRIADSAVKLARSKWICFLHDDDILAQNHLSVMNAIIEKHKKIKFLSTVQKDFEYSLCEDDIQTMCQTKKVEYQIKRYPKSYSCMGYYIIWQGALIDRKRYIEMGGMPTIKMGCGDYCMVQKFHYHYGVYELQSDTPLYYRRSWDGQVTAEGTERWKKILINKYIYHTYINQLYHRFHKDLWNRYSAYCIIDDCLRLNKGFYKTNIDIIDFVKECGIPDTVLSKDRQYHKDMVYLNLYQKLIIKIWKPVKYKGYVGVEHE